MIHLCAHKIHRVRGRRVGAESCLRGGGRERGGEPWNAE